MDADTAEEAWTRVLGFWPEAEQRFVEQKPDDWVPGDRFPSILAELTAKKVPT